MGVEWGEDKLALNQQLRKALESAELPVSTNISQLIKHVHHPMTYSPSPSLTVSNLLKALREHQKEKGGASSPPISWGEFCACCIALHAHQTQESG